MTADLSAAQAFYNSLPASMLPYGWRWSFGMSPDVALSTVCVFGTKWVTDGWACVDSGEPAPDEYTDRGRGVRGLVLIRERTPAVPVVETRGVRIGEAVISAAYYGLVTELHQGAVWEAEGPRMPVVAMVGERAVAVVMPLGEKT